MKVVLCACCFYCFFVCVNLCVCTEIDTSGRYWLLSSALLEDREIREAIQKEKLVTVLDFNVQNRPRMYCDIVGWETARVFGL